MIKRHILFLFLLFQFITKAQLNLVPNPSFEFITNCNYGAAISPGGPIWAGYAPPWDDPTLASPDLFNVCVTVPMYCIPSNSQGFQIPHTGNGYAGGVLYGNSRDYIQVPLDSTLVAQGYYCVSFYVSLGGLGCKVANNNIGMYFSDTHIYSATMGVLNYTPQINDTNIVSDSVNWTEISGVYHAQGGEHYIVIGNFYPDSLTDTILIGTHLQSYYYIDDVSVMRCSDVGVGETENANGLETYPNPANATITINYKTTSKKYKLKIIDALGNEVMNKEYSTQANTININELPPGIYLIYINDEKKSLTKRFIKE